MFKMGERILEIDGKDVREATLEEATRELENGRSEMVDVVTEYDGGERLKRLKKGADGDSFYMRVNIDRNGENGDELDIKKVILHITGAITLVKMNFWWALMAIWGLISCDSHSLAICSYLIGLLPLLPFILICYNECSESLKYE